MFWPELCIGDILHKKTVNTDSFYSEYLVKAVDTDSFYSEYLVKTVDTDYFLAINYPYIVDLERDVGRRMWIKKFLNLNIINFENVDKPEGGGSDNVDKVFCYVLDA